MRTPSLELSHGCAGMNSVMTGMNAACAIEPPHHQLVLDFQSEYQTSADLPESHSLANAEIGRSATLQSNDCFELPNARSRMVWPVDLSNQQRSPYLAREFRGKR
jgi:hypothetical protein